jgi:hypothetical protein
MNRRLFQLGIVVLWLALPLVALEYWVAWDDLPAHIATHFNAAGQANGWMARDVGLGFGLGVMAFLLLVFTPILWLIFRRAVDKFAWAFLGFCFVVAGFVAVGNHEVIAYNLHGTPVRPEPLLLVVPAAVVVLTVVYIGMKRGNPLPSGEVLAQETHTGRGWAVLFVPSILGPLMAAWLIPILAARISMALVALVLFAALAMAWSGFRYRFLRHGVEIRTLGYRLRSIPRQQIVSYAAESWNPLGGYGIRGMGHNRAFVWGNRVVHIKTTNGEVYLGHSDPQRVLRNLDLVTGQHQADSIPGSATGTAELARG